MIWNLPRPRRGLLKVLAGGAAGVTALVAGRASAQLPTPNGVTPVAPSVSAVTTLTYYSPVILTKTIEQNTTQNEVVTQTLNFAELYTQPEGGTLVGELRSIGYGMPSPWGNDAFSANNIEFHSFIFADGILYAMGAMVLDAGWFAIVGGTGKYLSATGRYRATSWGRGFGADTAQFVFDLTARTEMFAPAVEAQRG